MNDLINKNMDFIGLFDSGFGGISVLNYCIHLMPNENYIFFADSLNCPYGKKSKEELVQIGLDIISNFDKLSPKSLIIACGTMSTSDIHTFRNRFKNIKLIGTFPDFTHILKPNFVLENRSIEFSSTNHLKIKSHKLKILILATTATCRSEYLKEKIDLYDRFIDIYLEPADKIVKAVENDEIDSFYLRNYLEDILKSYKGIDYLVLGCTHFPFAENVIKQIVGDKVIITSGCEVAANMCFNYLKLKDNLNADTKKPFIKIIDAKLDEKRKNTFMKLLHIDKSRYNIDFIMDFNQLNSGSHISF